MTAIDKVIGLKINFTKVSLPIYILPCVKDRFIITNQKKRIISYTIFLNLFDIALVMDKWYCNENSTSTHHRSCPNYAACILGVCVVKTCQVTTGKLRLYITLLTTVMEVRTYSLLYKKLIIQLYCNTTQLL